MKKKLMIFLTATILTFSLVGCSVPKTTESSESNSISKVNGSYVYEFIDSDTGVHYLIYSNKLANAGMGGITPRLNSDGTVMTTK